MKDDNLGKMGGRKARKKEARHTPDLQRILDAQDQLEQMDTGKNIKSSYVEEVFKPVLERVELSTELIRQYLDVVDSTLDGDISGELLTALACRNKDRGKCTEIFYDGQGKKFNGIFDRAKEFDIAIIQNLQTEGNAFSGAGHYQAVAAINMNKVEKTCDTGLFICKNADAEINHPNGYVILSETPAFLHYMQEGNGELLTDGGVVYSLPAEAGKRAYPLPRIYCKQGILIVDWYTETHKAAEQNVRDLRINTEDAVILGKIRYSADLVHKDILVDGRLATSIFKGKISGNSERLEEKMRQRKTHLLDEIADCDVGRKFEIVREIMETYE